MKRRFWLIFFIQFSLALVVRANEGQWRTYTVADDLVSPATTIIFQDSRGIMWFGSKTGGITRFDGENFQPFTEKDGLPRGKVTQILEDKRGHLWFVTVQEQILGEAPSLISRYDGETIHRIIDQVGLTDGTSDAVFKDRSGNLWFANRHRLTRYNGWQVRHFGGAQFQKSIEPEKGKRGRIHAVFEGRNGDIWLAGGYYGVNVQTSSFVIRYDRRAFHNLKLPPLPEKAAIFAIAEDSDGNIWFGGRQILLKYDGKEFQRLDNTRHGNIQIPRPGRKAPVLIPTPAPGRRGDPRSFNPLNRARSPLNPGEIFIKSIFKDNSGNLWFNNKNRLGHWDGKELRHFIIPRDWEEIANALQDDRTELSAFYPGHVALQDAHRNLWFKSSNGAHRYDGKNFRTFTVDDGLGSDAISVIFEAMDGKFWFGHDNGVTVFDPSPPTIQNFTMRAALGSNRVRFIHEDRQGFVWFAVPGGVAQYDGKKLQYFSGQQIMRTRRSPSGRDRCIGLSC